MPREGHGGGAEDGRGGGRGRGQGLGGGKYQNRTGPQDGVTGSRAGTSSCVKYKEK